MGYTERLDVYAQQILLNSVCRIIGILKKMLLLEHRANVRGKDCPSLKKIRSWWAMGNRRKGLDKKGITKE